MYLKYFLIQFYTTITHTPTLTLFTITHHVSTQWTVHITFPYNVRAGKDSIPLLLLPRPPVEPVVRFRGVFLLPPDFNSPLSVRSILAH